MMIDLVYDDWCGIIGVQMYTDLPYKTVNCGVKNKTRIFDKP